MPDIFHCFPVTAAADEVFRCVSTAEGLNRWWTKTAEVEAKANGLYRLGFGEDYQWEAIAQTYKPGEAFQLQLTKSDGDWNGTQLGFVLKETAGVTTVDFSHTGWPLANEHYKISCFCWAMYLRLLKRFLEHGEELLYERRLLA